MGKSSTTDTATKEILDARIKSVNKEYERLGSDTRMMYEHREGAKFPHLITTKRGHLYFQGIDMEDLSEQVYSIYMGLLHF